MTHVKWRYECVESEPDDGGPPIWRVYREDDSSYEATVCELWTGEQDNEQVAREICHRHNSALKK